MFVPLACAGVMIEATAFRGQSVYSDLISWGLAACKHVDCGLSTLLRDAESVRTSLNANVLMPWWDTVKVHIIHHGRDKYISFWKD